MKIFSDSATVVVVGAGLSGLVAARELRREGVDVIVIDAQPEPGGRIKTHVRPNGSLLDTGGGSTGLGQEQLLALAQELGVNTEPLPAFADPEHFGKSVRLFEGTRFVEHAPLEGDVLAAKQHADALVAFAELASTVPPQSPWNAADADLLDRQSIGHWIDQNLSDPAAAQVMRDEFAAFGDVYEVSLLHGLWFLSRFGGWEAAHDLGLRFVGGTGQIIAALAAEMGDRLILNSPVDRVDRGQDHVIVHHRNGSIRAEVAIVAMEPGQAGKIEFTPPLPPIRDRLQHRWTGSHGAKYYAIYDRPFWRDEGLSGFASGPAPFNFVMDQSPSDNSEGILLALHFATDRSVAENSAMMSDEEQCRSGLLDTLALYFGEQARSPREYYAFSWAGNRWSDGCAAQLPMGVVSTLLPALSSPVGRILWAGAESGDTEWMEGAVTAGIRAAREARGLI